VNTNHDFDSEKLFDRFVDRVGGTRVAALIAKNPTFDNADYLFESANVIAELKCLRADFATAPEFKQKTVELGAIYIGEGRMAFGALFGAKPMPREFVNDALRLLRPPLARVLKKANRQLRETKSHLGRGDATGVALIVNDGFITLEPHFVVGLISNILLNSYSSIDAFVYITINHYVLLPKQGVAALLWAPTYSDRAPDSLCVFLNELGAQWRGYLDEELGPFEINETSDEPIHSAGFTKAVKVPNGEDADDYLRDAFNDMLRRRGVK